MRLADLINVMVIAIIIFSPRQILRHFGTTRVVKRVTAYTVSVQRVPQFEQFLSGLVRLSGRRAHVFVEYIFFHLNNV